MRLKYFLITLLITAFQILATGGKGLNIPPRPADAPGGAEFMNSVKNLSFAQREAAILTQLQNGNIPDLMRELVEIEATFTDLNNVNHNLKYWVMPDYLCIGSDDDYCRVPMGPIIAQTAADLFGATMPTRKLVDNIYINAEIKLQPVTYTPVGNQNEQVVKFIQHNTAIQNQFENANGTEGQLVGGTKKDVVISNKIIDPSRPGHVTIYGWHWLSGSPIQPLTNIHTDTYVDYSHGIRFLDNDFIMDGDTLKITDVLKDDVLYKVLSDESSPMLYPTYLFEIKTPEKPKSFGIRYLQDGRFHISIKPDTSVDKYHVELGKSITNFDMLQITEETDVYYQNTDANTIYYLRIKAENSFGFSEYSEVLAANTLQTDKALIVNGFDRTSEGNTFNFVKQHAMAMQNAGVAFESVSNEALTDGMFSLRDYKFTDFVLGDESTADMTFSPAEQDLVEQYLENGGSVFVSGAEIAWDLDYKGTTADKNFIHNYLKAGYSADAPGNASGTHYSAKGVTGQMFEPLGSFNFDNGTQGTINVKYADALILKGGAKSVIHYNNVSSHNIGGVFYSGLFGNGTKEGKVIYLGFPFETIYPESARNNMMQIIADSLYYDITSVTGNNVSADDSYMLYQNYPNPFNPSTTLSFYLPEAGFTRLEVFNSLGQLVEILLKENKPAGDYSIKFNGNGLTSGIYFYKITSGSYSAIRKMILLK